MRAYNCSICGKKHLLGEQCPNRWKSKREKYSDKTKQANQFYNSKAWQSKREQIKSLDRGLCQRCLIKFNYLTMEGLEVHHIEPLTTMWEKRLLTSNLITLCVNCHRYVDMVNNGKLDFEFERIEEEFDFEF